MGSTCDRMGCAAPATVMFGADPIRTVVVMQALDPAILGNLRPGILCTEHADRLTVPLGWTLDDQRESTPRLFRVPTAPVDDDRDRSARPTTPSAPTATFEQPSLVDDVAPDADIALDAGSDAPDADLDMDPEVDVDVESDADVDVAVVDASIGETDARIDAATDVSRTADPVLALAPEPVVEREPSPELQPEPRPEPVVHRGPSPWGVAASAPMTPLAPVTPAASTAPMMDEIPMALEWDERDDAASAVVVDTLFDAAPDIADDIADDDADDDLEVDLERASGFDALGDDGAWGDWTLDEDRAPVRELEYVRDPDAGVDTDFEPF